MLSCREGRSAGQKLADSFLTFTWKVNKGKINLGIVYKDPKEGPVKMITGALKCPEKALRRYKRT